MAEGGIMQSNIGVLFLLSVIIDLVVFTMGAPAPVNDGGLALVAIWIIFICFMLSVVIFTIMMCMSSEMTETALMIVAIYHVVGAILVFLAGIAMIGPLMYNSISLGHCRGHHFPMGSTWSWSSLVTQKLFVCFLCIINSNVYAATGYLAFKHGSDKNNPQQCEWQEQRGQPSTTSTRISDSTEREESEFE